MYLLTFVDAKLGNTFHMCKYFSKKSCAKLNFFRLVLCIT